MLYQATLTELASLIVQAQAHRSCQLAIGEGEAALNLTLEVDYWTRGRLSEYEATLQALQEQLGRGWGCGDPRRTSGN
ncbi:MAG: hypothetical protein HC890_16780 [Chloroflexaceae bacterium]|nr:hypothetical protein [Chloroflexaceae bacterium]